MVSKQTVLDIYAVIVGYVPDDSTRGHLLEQLSAVRGNKSFTDTVGALISLHQKLEREKNNPEK